jgi:hypothetical protein
VRAQEKGDIARGNPRGTTCARGRTMNASLREIQSNSNGAVAWCSGRLWSLWDMLQSYYPIYQIALDLEVLRSRSKYLRESSSYSRQRSEVSEPAAHDFAALLKVIHQKCLEYNMTHTSDMAKRVLDGDAPTTYADMFSHLNHLDGSLIHELNKEAVFRIPPERKDYFEHDTLFGPEVAAAFPSCERDIRKAGSCYALGQEDACVHHLMLVLERGLYALAAKVGVVSYQHANWQTVIDQIASQLKSSLPPTDRAFYRQVNAQFGFLKEAYRNHSAHTRDDPYDMARALSILNHVRDFMRELEKGGLSNS